MAKGLKIEIIGYSISCEKSGRSVIKHCSHKFQKEKELKAYTKKYREKYEKKYPNKTINGIKFGKSVNIGFIIGREK